MNQNLISVAIGEMQVSNQADDVLVSYGLGSCVAICLYDPTIKAGGMLHALLPIPVNGAVEIPTRFVNPGLFELKKALLKLNARPSRLVAHLCGGAQVLSIPGETPERIGTRNVQMALELLEQEKISLLGQATGGNHGRTARSYIGTGEVTVRKLGETENLL